MPDVGSLYPQPPQQQPQGSSLLSNPAQAIGIMQGLQNLQIQSQQAPALVQQPQAQLDQVRTAITTARQAQQADAQHRVAAGLGAMIPDGAKPDVVHSAAAYLLRLLKSRYYIAIPGHDPSCCRFDFATSEGHHGRQKYLAELGAVAGGSYGTYRYWRDEVRSENFWHADSIQ